MSPRISKASVGRTGILSPSMRAAGIRLASIGSPEADEGTHQLSAHDRPSVRKQTAALRAGRALRTKRPCLPQDLGRIERSKFLTTLYPNDSDGQYLASGPGEEMVGGAFYEKSLTNLQTARFQSAEFGSTFPAPVRLGSLGDALGLAGGTRRRGGGRGPRKTCPLEAGGFWTRVKRSVQDLAPARSYPGSRRFSLLRT
jgi:hypothetical protein